VVGLGTLVQMGWFHLIRLQLPPVASVCIDRGSSDCHETLLTGLGRAFGAAASRSDGRLALGMVAMLAATVLGWFAYRHTRQQAVSTLRWGWTSFLAVFLATQAALVAQYVDDIPEGYLVGRTLTIIAIAYVALLTLMLLLSVIRRRHIRNQLRRSWRQYYPNGSVGRGDDDIYGFADSADDFARSLVNETAYVALTGVYGGMGQGKSSFWRMTLESELIKPEETLYTYLSLTEANKTSDLSSLFAERWLETLKERYPLEFALSKLQLERLRSVLREAKGTGFILAFLAFFEHFNKPLFKMRVAANGFDPFLAQDKPDTVQVDDVRKVFNNLPAIHEKRWIICFDEIERAPMDEVLRAMEIVERFKQIGQTGLPVQIIFVFLFDEKELAARCQKPYGQNDHLDLVRGFFVNNPKLFTLKRPVPFVSDDQRRDAVDNEVLNVATKLHLPEVAFDDHYDIGALSLNELQDTFYDRQATSDIMVQLLASQSLRTMRRTIDRTRNIYVALPRTAQAKRFKRTFLSDVVVYALCEIEYPQVLEIVKKGYSVLFRSNFQSVENRDLEFRIRKMRLKSEQETRKATGAADKTLFERIEEEWGIQVEPAARKRTLLLLSILLPQLWGVLQDGEDMTTTELLKLRDRLAFPDNLAVVLGQSPQQDTHMAGDFKRYETLINTGHMHKSLDHPESMDTFVRLFRIQAADERRRPRHLLQVMEALIKQLADQSSWSRLDPVEKKANSGYRLCGHFAQLVVDASFSDGFTDEDQKTVRRLFKELIEHPDIPLTYRLQILDDFAHPASKVSDYILARERLLETNGAHPNVVPQRFASLEKLFREVYASGDTDIYAQEPDPFYVTRSLSVGQPNGPEMKALRRVMTRSLGQDGNASVLDYIFRTFLPINGRYDRFGEYKSAEEARGKNYLLHIARPPAFLPLKQLMTAAQKNEAFKQGMQNDPELRRRYRFWLSASKDDAVVSLESESWGGTIKARIELIRQEVEKKKRKDDSAAA